MSSGKVVGYLAYVSKAELICDGNSCIIAGSREKMKSYIEKINPEICNKVTITKARFGDIKRGLEHGAAYSFDEESYGRFYPLAAKTGISIGPEDFTGKSPAGFHFVRIEKMHISRN